MVQDKIELFFSLWSDIKLKRIEQLENLEEKEKNSSRKLDYNAEKRMMNVVQDELDHLQNWAYWKR